MAGPGLLVSSVYTVYSPETSFSREDHVRGRLDSIDWAILKELQADGSITNVELARRVGLSAPPCLRRVRALERRASSRPIGPCSTRRRSASRSSASPWCSWRSRGRPNSRPSRITSREWPVVRECWTLSGDIDFILKCVAPNLGAFQGFVSDLTSLPNVRNVRTALALDQIKDEPLIPIEDAVEIS